MARPHEASGRGARTPKLNITLHTQLLAHPPPNMRKRLHALKRPVSLFSSCARLSADNRPENQGRLVQRESLQPRPHGPYQSQWHLLPAKMGGKGQDPCVPRRADQRGTMGAHVQQDASRRSTHGRLQACEIRWKRGSRWTRKRRGPGRHKHNQQDHDAVHANGLASD